MRRIIICDSGATKADWRIVEDGRQTGKILSPGMNVSTMKMETVASIIRNAASELPSGEYDGVYFYTAGVLTPSIKTELEAVIGDSFCSSTIELQTDMIASARAACGHESGIAAIMGTGSNSCQWDGERIVRQIRSGGFIIGDEGSASALGKLFISDFIKGLVPEEIANEYARVHPSDYTDIIEKLYHNPESPSGWLGSLCPFILSFHSHPYIKDLVERNIRSFVERNLKQYDISRYPVGIIGGFADALKHVIVPVFEQYGIKIRAFIPTPADELVKYHA